MMKSTRIVQQAGQKGISTTLAFDLALHISTGKGTLIGYPHDCMYLKYTLERNSDISSHRCIDLQSLYRKQAMSLDIFCERQIRCDKNKGLPNSVPGNFSVDRMPVEGELPCHSYSSSPPC